MSNPFFAPGKPCFIVAEIGANHNGDIGLCLKSLEAAKRAGASAAKLQYYTARELVADVDRVWAWGREGRKTEERVGEMFDRLSLGKEGLARAYAYAETLGLPLFCTPFSVQGVGDLERLGNPIYKVASSDVNFIPMLEAIARLGKPVMLSTGKCPLEDVREAIETMRAIAAEDLALLHCIAQYPAPYEEMNIRVVSSYQTLFPGHPVGLSDHCMSHEPALASVVLGGSVIEKHFTLDHELHGPDHWFSMDERQFADLVSGVRRIEASLGNGQKGIADCEVWEATYSRRSIIVMRDVAKGSPITAEDLAILRPGTGLHPREWKNVVGRPAARDLKAREPLTADMLAP